MEDTYGKGHGQEHEHIQVAESSTRASVAITSDPSRMSCLTSTTDTIWTTKTDEDLSEHDALDHLITRVLLIPDVPVLMKPDDHDTTTTMDIDHTYRFIQAVIAPVASPWRKPGPKEPVCTLSGKTPPAGFSWSFQIKVRVCSEPVEL